MAAESSPPEQRRALIAFSWLWVGAPLCYGLYELVLKAKQLFTGCDPRDGSRLTASATAGPPGTHQREPGGPGPRMGREYAAEPPPGDHVTRPTFPGSGLRA